MRYPESTLATADDVLHVYTYCTAESAPHSDDLVRHIFELSHYIRKMDSWDCISVLCCIMLELGRIEGIRAERMRRNHHASH